MPDTVLVIGGAGYIGSTVVGRLLRDTDYNVVVFDRLMYGGTSLFPFFAQEDRFRFIYGDARQGIVKWTALLKELRPKFVTNFAALVGEHICKKYPKEAQEINEDASIDIAEACQAAGVGRYIFASTCSNYGKTDHLVDEEAPVAALSLYASTKINTEQHLLKGVPTLACTVLRFATIYGLASRVRFDLLVHEFIRDAWTQKKIVIFGPDGWRPFLHVDDAARGVLAVFAAHDKIASKQVYNVGSTDQNFQKRALGEMIQARLKDHGAVVEYNEKVVDKRSYQVDFGRIEKDLGFRAIHDPKVSVDQICQGLECGLISVAELDEHVNVKKDDDIRNDTAEFKHVARSRL